MNKTILKETRPAFPLERKTVNKIRWRENAVAYMFLGPALLILFMFLVVPSIMAVYYAFTDYYLLTPDLRQFIGFDNFIKLFQDPIFLKKFGQHHYICCLFDTVTDRSSTRACPPIE